MYFHYFSSKCRLGCVTTPPAGSGKTDNKQQHNASEAANQEKNFERERKAYTLFAFYKIKGDHGFLDSMYPQRLPKST